MQGFNGRRLTSLPAEIVHKAESSCERVFATAHSLFRQDEGQTLIEYGLIASLVSIAAMGALLLVAGDVNDLYVWINDSVSKATS